MRTTQSEQEKKKNQKNYSITIWDCYLKGAQLELHVICLIIKGTAQVILALKEGNIWYPDSK